MICFLVRILSVIDRIHINSERPKREKSVSAETEISAKLTESSAEISAETLPIEIAQKLREEWGFDFEVFSTPLN